MHLLALCNITFDDYYFRILLLLAFYHIVILPSSVQGAFILSMVSLRNIPYRFWKHASNDSRPNSLKLS